MKPVDNSENKSNNIDGSSLLLLHGTEGKNVKGILKEGFKPSRKGALDSGVYLTNHFSLARGYGNCLVIDKEFVKGMSYVFAVKVKQVRNSNKSLINSSPSKKKLKFKSSFAKAKPTYANGKRVVTPEKILAAKDSKNSYDSCEPFLNIVDDYSKKVSFKNTSDDLDDSEKSRIIKGSFEKGSFEN